MAIIVEEEKNSNGSGIMSLLGWFIILVALGASAYYLFFAAAPPAIVTPPAAFDTITPITQINFNPQSVISSPAFTSLTQTVPEPTAADYAKTAAQEVA